MAKNLDPVIAEVLKKYEIGHEACWNSHGTWVVYHKYLEQIAVKAGIRFEAPVVVEADGAKRIAAICVTGVMGVKSEWSIGEAAPGNNKNAYPWAMAEKRAKDRVILKLIGLHGIAYSEEEADDFKYKDAELSALGMDTDGIGPVDLISPEQKEMLVNLMKEVDADTPKFLKYIGVENIDQLPADCFNKAMAALEAKRRAKQ